MYELGQNATFYPADTGVILESGSSIGFTMHLHSVGTDVPVRVDVGFKFRPKGYKPRFLQSGFVTMGVTQEINLPAGQDNIRHDGSCRMQKAGILTTYEPHMHMSGKRMCLEAIYPSGQQEMLNCAGYNHNWVKVYTYEEERRAAAAEGHARACDWLVQQHRVESQEYRTAQLERLGQSVHR